MILWDSPPTWATTFQAISLAIRHEKQYCFLVVLEGARSSMNEIVLWSRVLLAIDFKTHPLVDVKWLELKELICRELMIPIVRRVYPVVQVGHQLPKAVSISFSLCGITDMDTVSHRNNKSSSSFSFCCDGTVPCTTVASCKVANTPRYLQQIKQQ
jgi:hypothetical protein